MGQLIVRVVMLACLHKSSRYEFEMSDLEAYTSAFIGCYKVRVLNLTLGLNVARGALTFGLWGSLWVKKFGSREVAINTATLYLLGLVE